MLLRTSKLYVLTKEKNVLWFKDYFESVWKEMPLIARRFLVKYWRSANTLEQRIANPVIELVQWDEVFYSTKAISACCNSGNRLVFHVNGLQLAPADVARASILSSLSKAYYFAINEEKNLTEIIDHLPREIDLNLSSRNLVSNWLSDNVIKYTQSGIVWVDKDSL